MNTYSQDKQDIFIYENFFKDKKDGFFIEIGANDGITLSNTLLFEKEGWNGICIEPILTSYEKLIKNRICKCIHGVIGNTDNDVDFLEVSGYAEMLSGILSEYNLEHLNRVNREISIFGGNKRVTKIKSYLFNNIITEKKIDYLSIDVEGGEFSILKNIDFNKYDITIISVENNYNDINIINFLNDNGYILITTLGADNIFKKNKI